MDLEEFFNSCGIDTTQDELKLYQFVDNYKATGEPIPESFLTRTAWHGYNKIIHEAVYHGYDNPSDLMKYASLINKQCISVLEQFIITRRLAESIYGKDTSIYDDF